MRSSATVEIEGLSIIRTLVGHGIGRDMHEDPQIPNFGEPGRGPELEAGMVLAIEPMVNAGGPEVRIGSRRLGRLLHGRLAGRPLRVHGRRHRGRPQGADALASRRLIPARGCYSSRSAARPFRRLRARFMGLAGFLMK